jgi:branched-chain amino acid transport system ATP-binding protein
MGIDLEIRDLVAGYGETVVLDGISLNLASGMTLALLGRNGVGKSTLLATLMGMTTHHKGSIHLGGRAIESLTIHKRVRSGLGYVPQEREIFSSLTVEENLAVSAMPGGLSREAVYDLFPALKYRRANTGNRLSGGEQQMLAIGRALVGSPQLLLLDEPLEGLAPIVVEELFETLTKIRDDTGMTMILAEQRAELALEFAQDVVVLDRGKIVHQGASQDLAADPAAQARLLGLSSGNAN